MPASPVNPAPASLPAQEPEYSSHFDLCLRITKVVVGALLLLFGFFALLNAQGVVDWGLGAMGSAESAILMSLGFLGFSASLLQLLGTYKQNSPAAHADVAPAAGPRASPNPPKGEEIVADLNRTLAQFYNSCPHAMKGHFFIRIQQGTEEIEHRSDVFQMGTDCLSALPVLDFAKHYRIEALLVIKDGGGNYHAGYCVKDSSGQNPSLKIDSGTAQQLLAACERLFANRALRLFKEREQVTQALTAFTQP